MKVSIVLAIGVSILGMLTTALHAGTPAQTAITYQGQLKMNGAPYSGSADFRIELHASRTPGQPPLDIDDESNVEVVNGLFTLNLDFNAVHFDGRARWLAISVRAPHDPQNAAAFTDLSERQPITPAPYAIHAFNADAIEESNWRNVGNNVVLPNGNAGVGVESPQSLLHLQKPLADTGIRFQTVRFAEGPPASAQRVPGATAQSGAGQAWSSPDSARVGDDVRATVNLGAFTGPADFDVSQAIDLTNAGFSIPPQAMVVGIQVNVEGSGQCSCTDCDRCGTSVTIELLGGTGSTEQPSVPLPATEGTVGAGGTFVLWGLDWTASQINAPDFGVRLTGVLGLFETIFCLPPPLGCASAPCDCNGNGSVSLDAVNVTVFFYDISATSTPVNWTLGVDEADSNFRFAANPDLATPVMVLSSLGSVGINTTEFSNGFFKLAVAGPAAKTNGGQWSTLSDARVKRNIEPLSGALAKLMSLRGVTFEFTDEGLATGLATPGRHTGFIAQEVEKSLPEWVGQAPNGYKFVTETGTTALLVEALRELRAENNAQIEAMTRRLEELEARLGKSTADHRPRP